jgi:hypothetical protein
MWLCLNNSFVSIVEDNVDTDYVWVRGRRYADVENFVGREYEIVELPRRDYRYRARITKMKLSEILASCAFRIDYDNFKNSVPVSDNDLYFFYNEIWSAGVRNLDPTWGERHK